MRWLRSAPTPTARRLLSPSLSCPLAKGATNDEVLRHWIYHIESTMQYADEKSASEGGEEEGRRWMRGEKEPAAGLWGVGRVHKEALVCAS